jgi:alkanesulfonate monooxygenase SsuD/methylene tetrahydromethanopterin reductase-like flavin-dependent oxidoreductase (luciferase family)
VGLGTGDIESHFELWGIDLPPVRERIEILREEIDILKRLWTEDKVSFEGKYYRLYEAPCNPKPLQKPHPPIWMGLVLGRTLMPKLIAELADGISVMICSDHAAKEHLENVEKYCSEVGRDFSDIEKARDLYVYLSEDEKTLPLKEQDLIGTLEEQAKKVKSAKNRDLAYEHVTRRYVIGTPNKVAEDLLGILDMGFDHLTIIGLNSLPELELFAQKVIPILKEH